MTNAEFKKKIVEAADFEWFKNLQETFNFPYLNNSQTFIGLSSLYEFINQQINGWNKIEQPLSKEFEASKTYFLTIRNQIIHFVNTYITYPGQSLNSYWNSIKNQIHNVNSKPLLYNIPQTDFLLRIKKETPEYFQGAYNFIIGSDYTVNRKELLYGAILAYEFTLKDKTEITERKKTEQISISRIRNDFQKYLNESEKVVVEHINNTNKVFNEYVSNFESRQIEKDKVFSTWFEKIKNEEWQGWYEPTQKKISELEHTYSEKLKLEEPAKYWEIRARKLKNQGWIALSILMVLVIIVCLSLGEILWKTPEQIYSSWFQGDKSAAIRWSIVYLTLLSFIAFALRAVNKVMFSSFHLARDCEERYTLTYFYLSLLKDSKVDDKDRQLIMQSLFSRAETGLLKEDSSPTMPSDTFTKFMQK